MDELVVPLDHLDEFKGLTENQRLVLDIYFNEPGLSKNEIAAKSGVNVKLVYKVLHSAAFKRLSKEMALKEKDTMVLAALRTLRGCLQAKQASVRLRAAELILNDSDVLHKTPSIQKTDNKIMVVWQDPKKPSPEQIANAPIEIAREVIEKIDPNNPV